jgi:hypothetical protein
LSYAAVDFSPRPIKKERGENREDERKATMNDHARRQEAKFWAMMRLLNLASDASSERSEKHVVAGSATKTLNSSFNGISQNGATSDAAIAIREVGPFRR